MCIDILVVMRCFDYLHHFAILLLFVATSCMSVLADDCVDNVVANTIVIADSWLLLLRCCVVWLINSGLHVLFKEVMLLCLINQTHEIIMIIIIIIIIITTS